MPEREYSDPNKSAQKAKAWIASQAGQAKLERILQLSSSVIVKLVKKRKVDPKSLKKPISR